MSKFILLICTFVFISPVQAKLIGKDVQYKNADTTMKGYLVYDDKFKGKRPGVLVVHEWWGHNEHARSKANDLAKAGYVAFAIDMYGDGKTADHPKDAGKFAGQVKRDMAVAEARFKAAEQQLKKSSNTNKDKIAAIGFCFGGGIVLEMARRGADLKGVVSFHGSLSTDNPAQKGKVKAKVLVLNGQADPFVKPESIRAFRHEMKSAKVDMTFVNYPDAKHAFTNPAATKTGKKFSIPLEYNAKADKESWIKMLEFFKMVLGK